MVSKREEEKAFEKLKEAYPNEDTSLEVHYCSWIVDIEYNAYIGNEDVKKAISNYGGSFISPMAAVDDIIKRRKEIDEEITKSEDKS